MARLDACDADPMLVRAAKHHGESAKSACPVCADEAAINARVMESAKRLWGELNG